MQAALASANALAERYKILLPGNGVSRQDYDNAIATQGQAAGDLAAARAAVQTARINLGYTDVGSPISRQDRRVARDPGRLRAAERRHAHDHGAADRSDLRGREPVERRRAAAPARPGERPGEDERRRRRKGRAPARRRHRVSAHGQIAVHRHHRRPEHGIGHGARGVSESRSRAAAGHVRARAHRARRERPGDARPPAGGHAQSAGAGDRAGGGRRQQGRSAHAPGDADAGRPMGRGRRALGRRARDRRRRAESAARSNGARRGSARQAQARPRRRRTDPWRSSSSSARSSRS